jgi:hypothetical protein
MMTESGWLGPKIRRRWDGGGEGKRQEKAQADLLRGISRNPFRRLGHDASPLTWDGRLISHLAEAAYDDRKMSEGTLDPGRLADALEESGHADAGLLEHLRGGPHYRGCHGIDAVVIP